MAQQRLDSFFHPKVPRLEKRVDVDGNSGGDGDEEDNYFSLQGNLKNCQRNWLQAERLDTLMVISAEGPSIEEFPFLMKWKAEKSQRIFSTPIMGHK